MSKVDEFRKDVTAMEICIQLPSGRRFCIPMYFIPQWWTPGDPPERRDWTEFEQLAALAAVAQLNHTVSNPISGLEDVSRAAMDALHEAVNNLGDVVELVGAEKLTRG